MTVGGRRWAAPLCQLIYELPDEKCAEFENVCAKPLRLLKNEMKRKWKKQGNGATG